eukprot:TRINITY_DN10241_c0_g1_i2.p1 TRINITY_DN10241_c0_g1~~TRINITY_DN10241_c0_g1_i2.p1  ORF type:complete len:225 (+),score=85.18 TRINITY_DN10241_c0_g1_i2:495-1169(+)
MRKKLEAKLERQRSEMEYKLASDRERTEEGLNEIRMIQRRIEQELPDVQAKADVVKRGLEGDLSITERQYSKLKALDKEQLPLKDVVAIKVFEATSKYMKDAGRAERELKVTKEELLVAKEKLDETKSELNRLKCKYDTAAEDCAKKIADYSARDKCLQTEVSELKVQFREAKEKVKKCEEVNTEYKDASMKLKLMQEQLLEKESANSRPVSYTHLTLPTICSV